MGDLPSDWGFEPTLPSAQLERAIGHDDDDITGLVAMDGSLEARYRKGGTTGWSTVTSADDGAPKGRALAGGTQRSSYAICGRCTRPCCTWSRREKALTDTATVHKGICRGRDWCTVAIRPHAAVPKKISTKLDDVGGEEGTQFTLSKVAAHQTKKVVDSLQGDELAVFNANNAAAGGKAGSGVVQRRDGAWKGHEGSTRNNPQSAVFLHRSFHRGETRSR